MKQHCNNYTSNDLHKRVLYEKFDKHGVFDVIIIMEVTPPTTQQLMKKSYVVNITPLHETWTKYIDKLLHLRTPQAPISLSC